MPKVPRGMPEREVAISKLRAPCATFLDQVSRTKAPLRVTRRGKAIADVVPVSAGVEKKEWLGSMCGSVEFTGDIVSPVFYTDEIDALRE